MVVSNTSPLIYLAALSDFELLQTLFDEIAIPHGVFEEIVIGGSQSPGVREVVAAQGSWIHVRGLEDASKPEEFRKGGLDTGESEALALALECRPHALLLDDSDAVRYAAMLGLNVIRTAGVYRLAKQRGLIPAVAPKLDDLRKVGFWLGEDHYRAILRSAGEG